jgi:hypothetical protein
MKSQNKILFAGLLALAPLALHAQSISGTSLGSWAPGDLVLAFDDPTSEPSNGNLIVDIGAASSYLTTQTAAASGDQTDLSSYLTAGQTYTVAAFKTADLTTVYGSSPTGVKWTVVGGNGSDGGPANVTFDSLWFSTPGSTALIAQNDTSQGGKSNAIENFEQGAINGTLHNGGLSSASANLSTSYNSLVGTLGNFGYQPSTTEALVSTSPTTLALYQLQATDNGAPGAFSEELGIFTLSGSGLTFTAIPEPSVYAAVLGALTLGFVMIRRRSMTSSASMTG